MDSATRAAQFTLKPWAAHVPNVAALTGHVGPRGRRASEREMLRLFGEVWSLGCDDRAKTGRTLPEADSRNFNRLVQDALQADLYVG